MAVSRCAPASGHALAERSHVGFTQRLRSVRQNQIGSAISVPFGAIVTIGVVYVQARPGAVLTSADLEDTELVGSMLDLVLTRVARPGTSTLNEAVRAFQYHRVTP